MKRIAFLPLLFLFAVLSAQTKNFRFAFLSDTHIGSPNGSAEEDLRRTVADINARNDVDFVVITGDVTELGKEVELALAKRILDSLRIRYYIIPGNHDTGWSESGGLGFTQTFGDDKFHFKHNGIHFIACASGPYVRMSDGHVPRSAVNWLQATLQKIGKDEPVIFLNHYPLDNGLDNWYEVIDRLKTRNTVLALCGHGHSNRTVNAEDIPAVMGRSNLRAKDPEGGYNLVTVGTDSITFTERKPVSGTEKKWKSLLLQTQRYDRKKTFPRPDFSINRQYPQVGAKWTFQSAANVISTPAVTPNGLVVFGNQNGTIEALDLETGVRKWTFQTSGPVFSSPALHKGQLIVGSADGFVYSLSFSGKLRWKMKTDGPVLGSPLVDGDVVFIGGSDRSFRAVDAATGKERWRFNQLKGPVVSKPAVAGSTLVFGAWDTHLYALDKASGRLLWTWNNGSPVVNYSPAACTPVVHNNVVYVAAPDRYLSAIDRASGKTLWRTAEATVRESIGLSEDGKLVYGKTMRDTVVAFHTGAGEPKVAWKMNAGFGYEHVPSMLVEKEGAVFFGTRNGVVYCLDPAAQKIRWAYKIDNAMINTVNVLNGRQVVASTMDGKICLLQTAD